MPLVQMTRGSKGLIQRAKHEREGDVECSVKPADGVGQCAGVLGDRRSDVRVGELEQERAASAEKNRPFSIDAPGQRGWAEYPFDLPRRQRLNRSELAFEVLAANYVALHELHDRSLLTMRASARTRAPFRP